MFVLQVYLCEQCQSESLEKQDAVDCCGGSIKRSYACGNCRNRYGAQAPAQVCCTGYELRQVDGRYELVRK